MVPHFNIDSLLLPSFAFKNSYDCIKSTQIIQDCVVVQSLSRVQLFGTPRTTTCEASLSFTISESLLRFMSIESVILSNHLFLCHFLIFLLLIFLSISLFLATGSQSIGASASVLPVNIQGWFPLGLIWSLCSPRDSQESSPAAQFKPCLVPQMVKNLSLFNSVLFCSF